MNKYVLAFLIPLLANIIYAQYPDVSIYEIQEVPVSGDESPLLDDTVHVCGIVTVGTDVFYAGAGVSFYIQDPQGGPFSGIYAYCPDSDAIPSLIRGDSICFDAILSYYPWPDDSIPCYQLIPGSLEFISSGHPLPEAIVITAEMIDSTGNADSLAGQYEACLVRINDVTVDSVIIYSNTSTWICHDSTLHQFCVREASDLIDYVPTQGTRFEYIRGVIQYRLGNYNIQPAYIPDISLLDSPIITDAGHWPENPTSDDTITISCNVTDDGEVIQVDLHYRINLGALIQVAMEEGDENEYYFIFPPLSPGCRLDYRIKAEDDEGNIVYWPIDNFMSIIIDDLSVINENLLLPWVPSLYQNYPNPFNASTTITFNLPEASFISLKVFDLLGREVVVLVEKQLAEGAHSVEFGNVNLTGGMYFYQLRAGDFTRTKRMTLLK